MSLYNTTNIKNLPQVDQIVDTDYMVVENYTGTNKLKFKDFVIGPTNASFYTSFKTNISELSGKTTTLNNVISSVSTTVNLFSGEYLQTKNEFEDYKTSNNVNITGLSASVDNLAESTALTASSILSRYTDIFNSYEDLKGLINNVYSAIVPFRWDNVSAGTSNTVSYVTFTIPWIYQLKVTDLIFVGPTAGVNDGIGYNGSLTYSLSTVFYYGSTNFSTYTVRMTSSASVPASMCVNYVPPGGIVPATDSTFSIRIFGTTPITETISI